MAPLGGSHTRHLRSNAAAMVITLGKSVEHVSVSMPLPLSR